jgi:hypothetical protein
MYSSQYSTVDADVMRVSALASTSSGEAGDDVAKVRGNDETHGPADELASARYSIQFTRRRSHDKLRLAKK